MRSLEPEDRALLRKYVEEQSEEAFAQLMHRYLDLVYSICRRTLSNPDLAEDATQVVFLHLARKAGSLKGRRDPIVGWLFQTARLVCRNLRRQQLRRAHYEAQAAQEQRASTTDDLWSRIEPHLFDALDALRPTERELLLLRFFHELDFAEIGHRYGIAPDTARMRVNRALTRLRTRLTAQGIVTSSEEELERTVLPSLLLVPAPLACEQKILSLIRADSLSPYLSQTYTGVLRTMRLKTIRTAATASLAALGIVLVGVTGAHSLLAANTALPVQQTPAPPAPTTPPASDRPVMIKVRVLERLTEQGGKTQEKVLQAPIISTRNDQEGSIRITASDPEKHSASDWKMTVLPHRNEDGTISLQLKWQQEEQEQKDGDTRRNQSLEAKRRLKPGQVTRITLYKGSRDEVLIEVTAQDIPEPGAGRSQDRQSR